MANFNNVALTVVPVIGCTRYEWIKKPLVVQLMTPTLRVLSRRDGKYQGEVINNLVKCCEKIGRDVRFCDVNLVVGCPCGHARFSVVVGVHKTCWVILNHFQQMSKRFRRGIPYRWHVFKLLPYDSFVKMKFDGRRGEMKVTFQIKVKQMKRK